MKTATGPQTKTLGWACHFKAFRIKWRFLSWTSTKRKIQNQLLSLNWIYPRLFKNNQRRDMTRQTQQIRKMRTMKKRITKTHRGNMLSLPHPRRGSRRCRKELVLDLICQKRKIWISNSWIKIHKITQMTARKNPQEWTSWTLETSSVWTLAKNQKGHHNIDKKKIMDLRWTSKTSGPARWATEKQKSKKWQDLALQTLTNHKPAWLKPEMTNSSGSAPKLSTNSSI